MSAEAMTLRAPAKLNLCLHLGPTREDGLHKICSVFCPLSLSDRLTVRPSEADEVVCEGIEGVNLAELALRGARERGWAHGPVRIDIEKTIPVAAGLGGGSADAAAVLRFVAASGGTGGDLNELAASIGADVPSQLEPRLALVEGAGELVRPLGDPAAFGVVLVPFESGLDTGSVYAEADRLGIGRTPEELGAARRAIERVAADGFHPLDTDGLLVNDLQRAAVSLRPEISIALQALLDAGAGHAMVTGSGPTAVGICRDIAAADRVAAALPARWAGAIVAVAERGGAV